MARKYVLLDDLDGKELPDGTGPVSLSLGRTTYNLYLSEANHGKLLKALEPFIENAETTSTAAVRATSARSASSGDKEKMRLVRAWAQSTGFKFKNSAGEEKTLGDRGRIPDEVVAAYDAAAAFE